MSSEIHTQLELAQSDLARLQKDLGRLPRECQEQLAIELERFSSNLRGLLPQAEPYSGESEEETAVEAESARAAWMARFPEENPDPVLRVAMDGRVLYRNQAAARLAGLDAEEGALLAGALLPLLEQAQARGESVRQDVQLGEKDYSFLVRPFPQEKYANLYGRDVTERKRAEEELRQSEERLRIVMEASPDLIWSGMPDGSSDYINSATQAYTGKTLEELNRGGWRTLIHPRDAVLVAEGWAEASERGQMFETEFRFRKWDGSYRWFWGRTVPVKEAAGQAGEQTVKWIGFMRDIEERKQAEVDLREYSEALHKNGEALRQYSEALRQNSEALRESETREKARATELEVLMDAVPAMILISRDPECREMISNRYGYEFLHMGPRENVSKSAAEPDLARQPFQNVKDGRRVPPAELPMQVAALSGQPARGCEMEILFEDGSLHHLLGNVNPLLDENGRSYGALGSFVDITALRRLQEQQIKAMAEVEVQRRLMDQREQERQGIARDIHDGPIQTLASTLFAIQLTKEAYSDPVLEVELNQIGLNVKSAVRELREVVNDLRPPHLIRFGLARAIQIYAEDMRERHADLAIETDLRGDSGLLSDQACLTLFRIFQEGLNNILRHARASKAWVRYTEEGEAFLLELRDNGSGFQPDLDFSGLTGSGHYGLAGIKERAESVGGTFELLSAPGQGTTLRARGPLLGKNRK